MRLLVTRPEGDAQRTAALLVARGHQVDHAPLLRIETVPDVEVGDGPWSALVITSANAIAAIAAHPRGAALQRLPVVAVGARTAAAAQAAGFADVTAAGGNLPELVKFLRGRALTKATGRPLLYLAGEDRSGDLAAELGTAGEIVATVVVYRAVQSAAFPPAVAAALAGAAIDGVLHYSARTAAAYVECARAGALLAQALLPTHFCLSGQVAEPLRSAGAERILVPEVPEEAALLALIG